MAYRNKIYVSFDADTDMNYYNLLKAWNKNEDIDFDFYNAHDINNIYDKSEESIKKGLQERFRNSKMFILLVGDNTKYLYKYVRWEIEEAIKRGLPIIVVNLNGKRRLDNEKCPPIIRDNLAIHVSFEAAIIKYAMNNWPVSFNEKQSKGVTGAYYYPDKVYESLDED